MGAVGRDVDELTDMISEIRNHYRLLSNLIESVCNKARLMPDSTDYRAIRRYQLAIGDHLRSVDEGLRRLARHPELHGQSVRHCQSL
jgi:hypothetical protein